MPEPTLDDLRMFLEQLSISHQHFSSARFLPMLDRMDEIYQASLSIEGAATPEIIKWAESINKCGNE